MEHVLTLSHTCCQRALASNLFKRRGGEETVRVPGSLGTAGPRYLGKLHKAYALVREVELPLVTAAVFQ